MCNSYHVVYPAGIQTTKEKNVAKSLPDLNGKVIGELWNWGFRGDETFPVIEEAIREKYPDYKILLTFFSPSVHGSSEDEGAAGAAEEVWL